MKNYISSLLRKKKEEMCKKLPPSRSTNSSIILPLPNDFTESTSQSNTIHGTGFFIARHARDPSPRPFGAYAIIPRTSNSERHKRDKVSVDRWTTIQQALTYCATRTLCRQDA